MLVVQRFPLTITHSFGVFNGDENHVHINILWDLNKSAILNLERDVYQVLDGR